MTREKLHNFQCVNTYFPPCSKRRKALRDKWNETNEDWREYLWKAAIVRGFSGMFGGIRKIM